MGYYDYFNSIEKKAANFLTGRKIQNPNRVKKAYIITSINTTNGPFQILTKTKKGEEVIEMGPITVGIQAVCFKVQKNGILHKAQRAQ